MHPAGNFPEDAPARITHSETAKALRKDFGIEDTFPGDAPPAGGVFACGFRNHPTHWVLFLCIVAPRERDDDAFVVFAFPKKTFGREKAEETVGAALQQIGVALAPPFFENEM